MFTPMQSVGIQYLSRAINGTAGWNEIVNYDAAWIAMNAYALTNPHAGVLDLWEIINNPYGAAGIGGIYAVDKNHDQSLSSYTFYTVTENQDEPEWKPTAYYRNVMTARDDLETISS